MQKFNRLEYRYRVISNHNGSLKKFRRGVQLILVEYAERLIEVLMYAKNVYGYFLFGP